MPPTLAEFRAAEQSTGVTKLREQVAEVHGLLRSAAVSSEKLTTSTEWNQYLQKLQPLLEDAQKSAALWLERCGGALSESDVRQAQLNYQACHARVNTLKEVMLLPHAILEAYREQSGTDQH